MEYNDEELPATQTPNEIISFETKIVTPPWGRLYPCMEGLQPYDLHEHTFRFGRLSSCNVSVQRHKEFPENLALNVSKIHFEISKIDNGLIYITDLSKNGTLINGNKVGRNNRNILENDDTISIYLEKHKIYVFKTLESETENIFLSDVLKKQYVTSRILGQGACGEVRLAFHKATCKKYAIKKIIKAKYISENKGLLNYPTKIRNEIEILQSNKHPFLINVHDVIETDNEVFIILEYMSGGDLTNKIISIIPLTEPEIKWIFYQIVYGVQYLHKNDITHRDLKPQNILLESDDINNGFIKISDFGLSKIMNGKSTMETVCGTLCYAAPEILDKRITKYNKQIDIWSLGVILYYMFTRTLPFIADDQCKLNTLIVTGAIKWNEDDWFYVSEDAQNLIRKMLIVNPDKRITIDEILKHEWIMNDPDMQEKFQEILNNPQDSCESPSNYCCPAKRPRLDNKTLAKYA